MSLLETRLSLYLIYFEALEEVGRIEMRGLSARWPCKETRNRENESHGGVHSGSRYRAALYAELKGYGEILWGRGRSHASFSAASLPLSVSPGPNKKKKKTRNSKRFIFGRLVPRQLPPRIFTLQPPRQKISSMGHLFSLYLCVLNFIWKVIFYFNPVDTWKLLCYSVIEDSDRTKRYLFHRLNIVTCISF